MGVRQRDLTGDRFVAPERNLEGIDGRRRLAGPKIDAAQQQVRFGLVGREIQGTTQFGHRLGVVSLLEKPPAAIEVKRRELLLLALPGVAMALSIRRIVDTSSDGFCRSNPRGIGSPAGRFLRPFRVGRRQLRRELTLARRLRLRAGRFERGRHHGVRFAVGGISADGFAQPEDGRRRILLGPVRVAEIEIVVGILLIDFHCLVEIVRGAAGFRRHRTPHLNHTEIVHHRRGR